MTQVRGNTENPAPFTGFMSENERVLTLGKPAKLPAISAAVSLNRSGCQLHDPVIEIAVGTLIADRPPHGPGRALISASGSSRR